MSHMKLSPELFPSGYKMRMLQAYSVIAQMSPDDLYWSTADEREEAFLRILDNRHLRRTHEMYLEDLEASP